MEQRDPAQAATLTDAAPGHVLLVGHPRGEGALHLPTSSHPPPYRFMRTDFHGDHALVHGALSSPPRHAVGRLPARTRLQLEQLVDKVIRPAPPPPDVVHFLDGDPQWGRAINRICDRLAALSARARFARGMTVLRTSFNPTSRAARADAARCLTHGARLWIYVGHGQKRSVDGLDVDALTEWEGGALLPLALFACCHAGALLEDDPSLAEAWLLAQGGPRAVVAGSNVTDPRINPALALTLAERALGGGTVGDAFLAAQQAMLTAPTAAWAAGLRLFASRRLREAHLGLYNLLGDPSMPLPTASAAVTEPTLHRAQEG